MKNRELNIAHFSFKDDYGAMSAAYELHKTLIKKGIKSTFFVREKTREDDSIAEIGYSNSMEERLLKIINKLYFDENRINSGIAPVNFDCIGVLWDQDFEDMLKMYDIFHIHWVAGLLSMDNIYRLSQLGKPIVWTMHDFHVFTGGCHCPESCKKYEKDCSGCPALIENYMDVTRSILLEKQNKYSKNIQIVTASAWLQEIVHLSKVFRDNPCEIIPIGIDTDCFVPRDKREIRQKLGLSADTKVILAGAQAMFQNVKGYVHFKAVLEKIAADSYCKELIRQRKLVLLTFGYAGEAVDYGGKVPIIHLGFIKERERLCEIYNAADVFVFPSVQDTFGMTATEAMSCGVPAVAFDISAMKEVIISGENGYKAQVNDASDMADCIVKILKDNPIDPRLCRKRIVDFYSLSCEAEKIIQLYHKLMEGQRTTDDEVFGSACKVNKKDKEMNIELHNFIGRCSFDILRGIAPNQRTNMTIQELLLEYNPEFVTPEQKVNKLLEEQKINCESLIYIYGAGEYGKRTLSQLEKSGIHIQGFWDMDEKKNGKTVEGYLVSKPGEKECVNERIIIVAGVRYLEMIKCLMGYGYLYCQDFY
ncbi:MAG: glycosyltransferase [Lachnospiraceae bacterium]|nr:glycosyltransferase [Lachnospiraceae bacterium]